MRRPIRLVSSVSAVFALVVLLSGCSKDEDNPLTPQMPVDTGIPDTVAQATTPANLLIRFEAAYEYEDKDEYGKLLTADYRFAFSSQADPDLVTAHGDTWDRTKELTSLDHLLTGFTDEQGEFRPPMTEMDVSLSNLSGVADPDHPDSTDHYTVASINRLFTHIVLSDGREFHVDAPHDLYLVRGDAAVLASGQEARADRWYIRRWEDKSPALSFAALLPTTASTFGRIKAAYLR